MKRKQGRPKLPKGDLRCVRLPIRVKTSEEELLRKRAESEGVSLTNYIRSILIKDQAIY